MGVNKQGGDALTVVHEVRTLINRVGGTFSIEGVPMYVWVAL